MTDLILYIVKSLVTNPDAVSVEEQNEGGQVNLLLTVDPADMGLVIGKGGGTIKAIRKVLIVKAMADNVRVNLQLAEPDGGRAEKSEESAGQQVSEPAEDQQVSETAGSAESVVQTTSEPETPVKAKKSRKTKKEAEAAANADQAETPDPAAAIETTEQLVQEHSDQVAEQD